MNNNIFPCLWFDDQAKAAADFYCATFSNSKIMVESPMVVKFEIEGCPMMGLNGGPKFKINPSISFFVTCTSDEEIEREWKKLSDGGKILMALNEYPWSKKYGWTADKFGMPWQLMLDDLPKDAQKITPAFLFTNEQYGNAEEAMKHYSSIFPNSKIIHTDLYKEGGPQAAGKLKFGQFSINNFLVIAMDGPGNHTFQFNEAVSLIVECGTQDEIDHYWNKLIERGSESQCGWLKDKFGVSWQIVPSILGKLMSDPTKGQQVMTELLKMKKLDLGVLMGA